VATALNPAADLGRNRGATVALLPSVLAATRRQMGRLAGRFRQPGENPGRANQQKASAVLVIV
jgi:hypothetical protein